MTESPAVRVDPSNAEQLDAWDGAEGAFWAARADRLDEGVAAYQNQLLDAAAIEETSVVLDIGCGSGRTTLDAARRATAGSALGVDLSSRMIELGRKRAEGEGLTNATFRQADAQVHAFSAECFDVAVSRSGAMFFGDAPAAFANIARAVRPGGRLALLAWQPLRRNEWMNTFRTLLAAGNELSPLPPPGTPGPFALSEPEQVRELLTSAGFAEVELRDLSEPMYFGRDVEDACEFVTEQFGWIMADFDADTRARAVEDLRANMEEHQTDRGVLYDSATWLIEARRG